MESPRIDKRTKDILLLESCIKDKWERILNDGIEEKGGSDCRLCKEYCSCYKKRTKKQHVIYSSCIDCPIYLYGGGFFCTNTPYAGYVNYHNEREWIIDEIYFLKEVQNWLFTLTNEEYLELHKTFLLQIKISWTYEIFNNYSGVVSHRLIEFLRKRLISYLICK